ncbi:MAG TPA: 3-hydroxybutyryl-CoA dehydrogenase [Thermoleophilaceae bacterium]|nr:3-hydroxybutyryl-CoA dehydrogenase [Thermoleophilaceae bacterium]
MSDASVQPRAVGVVGAGLMGSGIAETVARAGASVILHEPDARVLDRSRAGIARSLERAQRGGKLTAADAAAALRRIVAATDLDALAEAEIVVEAVTEDVSVKRRVFRALDGVAADDALLASNTSSIPIAVLARETARPEQVVGLHFFSPVPVMRLVEIVVALDTGPQAVERAEVCAAWLGKRAIRTKDRSGFVVNMLLVPYLVAAVAMLEEGFATREDIDDGMRLGCGHPMGPLALCDFIGLDVVYAICESLYDEFKQPAYAPPPLLKRMVATGRLGRKSGIGFYDYKAAAAAEGRAA